MSASSHNHAGSSVSLTAKQPPLLHHRDWYPYYAGFSERFVDAVLTEYLSNTKAVLDPWSGSGTTTTVCLKRGVMSKGVDINPALTIVAQARLTPPSYQPQLARIAGHLLGIAQQTSSTPTPDDLLQRWIRSDAVSRIRSIQDTIHFLLAQDCERPTSATVTHTATNLPVLACFFYCVLFAVVRHILDRFRATNPMWLKKPYTSHHRIARPGTYYVKRFRTRCAT